MTLERQILIWTAVLLVVLGLLHLLGSAVTPFATGICLAYLLDPVVRRLQRMHVSRFLASLLILGLFVIVLAVVLVTILPILANQTIAFAQKLPDYVQRLQSMAMTQAVTILHEYGGSLTEADGKEAAWIEQLQHSLGGFVDRGAQWLLNSAGELAYRGSALLDFVSLLVVTPVVAFYMLVDWDRMTATLDTWLPREHRSMLRRVGGEINAALAGFFRGQLLVCLSLAFYYAIGLTLIRLNFGFLLGVSGGALAFIPYVGSLTVMVLSLGIGLVQGWPNWTLFLEAFVVVAIGQFLEAYVISPKLVGESVGLHPVWLMFSLFAGGALFGFVGLMLAVPAAAAIGVLARHLLGVYFSSPLYLGREGANASPTAE